MSRPELDIGSLVQLSGLATGYMAPEISYRIEQLLQLDGGGTLYKVRNEAEPFDRVVAASELAQAAVKHPA